MDYDTHWSHLCYGDGSIPEGVVLGVGKEEVKNWRGAGHAPFGWHWSALIALVAVVRATL